MTLNRFITFRGKRTKPPALTEQEEKYSALRHKKGGQTLRNKKMKVTLAGNHGKAPSTE